MGSTRGIALVVTLLALLVLVALTGALIPLTSSETAISAHHRRAAQTLYAAEAALEWALQELQPVDSWDACWRGAGAPRCGRARRRSGWRTARRSTSTG